jgi:hypothetical protein
MRSGTSLVLQYLMMNMRFVMTLWHHLLHARVRLSLSYILMLPRQRIVIRRLEGWKTARSESPKSVHQRNRIGATTSKVRALVQSSEAALLSVLLVTIVVIVFPKSVHQRNKPGATTRKLRALVQNSEAALLKSVVLLTIVVIVSPRALESKSISVAKGLVSEIVLGTVVTGGILKILVHAARILVDIRSSHVIGAWISRIREMTVGQDWMIAAGIALKILVVHPDTM